MTLSRAHINHTLAVSVITELFHQLAEPTEYVCQHIFKSHTALKRQPSLPRIIRFSCQHNFSKVWEEISFFFFLRKAQTIKNIYTVSISEIQSYHPLCSSIIKPGNGRLF